ncbi:hypothetical protein [Oricola nitratireducens]|uniref:hypothetical protein n=1 Tax=Oricola nitratireducens TaxID=2775868 RepID=UPI0018689902|nr:hypothetical protein [Oricola nitratireducens]
MNLRHHAYKATAAVAIVFALSPHAFAAVDANAVFDALVRQMSAQGFEMTSDSVEAQGNDIVISNLKVTVPNGNDGFQMEKLLLEDVEEAAHGAYIIGRIAAPSFSSSREGTSFKFEGATVEGYYLAGPDEPDPIAAAGVYRALNIGAIDISQNGNTIFALDGITSTMSPYEPGATLDIAGKVNDFFIDFSKMPDHKIQATMTQVGYPQLRGRINGSGTWNTDSGDLKVQQAVELDDAAKLNINFDIGGYSAELIAALKELQKNMEGQSDEAVGFAMLGLTQQIEVGKISIELVDDSATGRILDYVAKQQGTNREAVIAQAKGFLPFALAQLQNDAFAAKTAAAVGAFLSNPKTLSIVAAPANPVPVAQIMAAGMSAPGSVVDMLGVSVTADE